MVTIEELRQTMACLTVELTDEARSLPEAKQLAAAILGITVIEAGNILGFKDAVI